jgi:hypothetical protein
MTKRGLIILIVAVLAVGFGTAAIASSIGGSEDQPVHTLPNGQTHTGEMPPTQHQMPDGEMMPGSDGSGMGGSGMGGMDVGE